MSDNNSIFEHAIDMKAIQEGKFTQKDLDDKVRRVLRLFYRTTMNPNRPHGFLCSESHYAAACG